MTPSEEPRRKRPLAAPRAFPPQRQSGTRLAGEWSSKDRFDDAWHPGEYWPATGKEICQYSAAGEVASLGAFFRGLKRRYGNRELLWWLLVGVMSLMVALGFL
ncbi:MAG TPA: hypothetical protein VFN61_16965 [Acidimicrobiales bacterium]|nr:hypothetical protein [Acidimicrobiales bacterium]